MQNLETKKKVLSEIMDLMDEKEGEGLKRHPKFMASKTDSVEPALEAAVEEPKPEVAEESDEEMTPEMVKKLLEMYEDME